MNEKCRPDDYPPHDEKGPLARRLAALQPKPVEDRRPAWLRNVKFNRDLTGALR